MRRRRQESPILRGEREISRKAIAQGMSDCLRCPVCSCAIFVLPFARETAGAARIRHSLLPLLRDNETQTSGVSRRENADVYLLFEIRIEMSLRHCERSEAIHFTKQRKSGLLRCARNDVDRLNRMPRHHPSLTHIAHQRHEATWCSGARQCRPQRLHDRVQPVCQRCGTGLQALRALTHPAAP